MKFSAKAVLALFVIIFGFNAGATTYFVNVANPSPVAPYTNWPTAATDIQSAVDAATNGDLILVTKGVYNTGGRVVLGTLLTNRVVINKPVTVQSVSGPAVTMIQGYQIPSGSTAYSNNVRCAYMTNNVVLDGFTIAGGGTLSDSTLPADSMFRQLAGGGVLCESTNATLTNCVLTGNVCYSTAASAGGGGVYQGTLNSCILSNNLVIAYSVSGGAACKSILNNCLIISNSACFGGGAANSTLNGCMVVRNRTPYFLSTSGGGGTYFCVANNCLIAGNYSGTWGGGDYNGILNRCILSNNTVGGANPGLGQGGGSYQIVNGNFSVSLNNCLVISNFSYGNGGGVYGSGLVCNCTIVGNTATNQYGGVYRGYTTNCIIYYNTCNSNYTIYYNYYGQDIDFCSTTPMLYYNKGGITNEPMFVNASAGNFRLSSNSPCINAGKNFAVTGTNDLDGNPRIVGGAVDLGAYEYQTSASIISYAWLQQYGLLTDGTADFVDLDGDGMNNCQEWIAGTNPTNAASFLQMLSASNSVVGPKVTWQSVSGETYYMQRSTNLAVQPAFSSVQSNLTGQAGTTSFTDTTATNGNSFFYRVGVQ